MHEPNHIADAAKDAAITALSNLRMQWPNVTFTFHANGEVDAAVPKCSTGECVWENDPDAPADKKGSRCKICGCKVPF